MDKPQKKVWVIRHSGQEFYMMTPEGEPAGGIGKKPTQLARYAWDHGADEVKHDYDLTLAE